MQVPETIEQYRHRLQQLEALDERKDLFLRRLAHDIGNIMLPFQLALQILKQQGTDAAIVEQVRDILEDQIPEVNQMIERLRAVARVARGNLELQREDVDLVQLVREAALAAAARVKEMGLRLELKLAETPVEVHADERWLGSVVDQLLDNALQFTDSGGEIVVEVQRQQDEAVLVVRDSGRGITAELLPKIFELFVTGDADEYSSSPSLGIGLPMAKKLVELHGGTIRASSEGEGRGSRFEVRLPVVTDERQTDGGGRGSCRVLIVDDSVAAAKMLARLLKAWNYEVEVVHDGEKACRLILDDPPKIVFLDIGLPGMNGFEVARRVREQVETKQTVLVALTGFESEADRHKSSEAGFDHYLVKPVSIDDLKQTLDSVC